MTDEPVEVVAWKEFIVAATEAWPQERRPWVRRIVRSEAFAVAFQGMPDSPYDDALRQAVAIVDCLMRIEAALPYRHNPKALLDTVKEELDRRNAVTERLHEAATVLLQVGVPRAPFGAVDKQWAELARVAASIHASPVPMTLAQHIGSGFDPANYRRKGAATNPENAFNGWMVRELSRYVTAGAPKRAAAIAQLLAIVGVGVQPTSVATLLRRG
jgi:hypothetical protein